MASHKRCFLVAKGPKNGYPNYKDNEIKIIGEDPAISNITSTFLCSPLFSVNANGCNKIPFLSDGARITFYIVPNIFPGFSKIRKIGTDDELWFSIGLANLVVIESDPGSKSSKTILEVLIAESNVVAAEQWEIKGSRIHQPKLLYGENYGEVYNCKIKISDTLPLNLKFAVSEYIISVDKFLTASKKFTPQYFENHLKTIEIANSILINDLSFLNGDNSFHPSDSIINSLMAKDEKEAFSNLHNKKYWEKKEELINDRHGRLIQFNSSLSYLYSQAYSGTFPLFDHNGLVRRHSLLGIGTAISALYELVCQIEQTFSLLPFGDFKKTPYTITSIPDNYYNIFRDPSRYTSEVFKNDELIKMIQLQTAELSKNQKRQIIPDNYYNRLAFYSGRLGFREYDFSATAAIQVLVESHSLEWHVINYTHEIIHNHVRIILMTNLIHIPWSLRGELYNNWLTNALQKIAKIHKRQFTEKLSYKDFFTAVLVNYCINAHFFGSLSRESNHELVTNRRSQYAQPTSYQLKHLIKAIYRDINEIFVHIIDFAYIYKRDNKAYLLSIWASWSTVPSVTIDLKQYIVRTLIVISLSKKGTSKERFDQAKIYFLSILPELVKRKDAFVYDLIKNHLENDPNDDLYYRFCNCIIVGDIVFNFFTGNIEALLENGDTNIAPYTNEVEFVTEDDTDMYDLDTGEFPKREIKSKTVFLLDQLLRHVRNKKEGHKPSDEETERKSSWLLLSLSSYNKI